MAFITLKDVKILVPYGTSFSDTVKSLCLIQKIAIIKKPLVFENRIDLE
jgi:hypothetical protein